MKRLILIFALFEICLGQYRITGPLYIRKSNADTTTARFITYNNTAARTYQFKNADGTVILDLDTTAFRTFSNLKYLKNADSTSIRTFSDLKYLKNADSTSFRTFSDLKYLKNADSTTQRNYSNALYPLKTLALTIAANTPLSSSAGAQDLSANRTWTLSVDTSNTTTGLETNWQKYLDSIAVLAHLQDSTLLNTNIVYKTHSNTFTPGTLQTIPRAVIDTLYVGSVVLKTSAGLSVKKANIQTAINDFVYGDVISVSPGTYNENLTIADSGVVITGFDNKNTRISGTVTITGKDAKLEGLRYDSTVTIVCTSPSESQRNILFKTCSFYSGINAGTTTDTNVYALKFDKCLFNGSTDTIYTNAKNTIDNKDIFFSYCTFGVGGYTLYLNGSDLVFENCDRIFFDGVIFDCTNRDTEMESYNCSIVMFGDSSFKAINNGTNFAILSINSSYIGNYGTATSWTFSNRFEVDFRHCSLDMPSIVWNSTAPSRWEHCAQRPYGSTATLTGTGLANLYISYSIFKMDTPAGLTHNTGNSWEHFIDD